MGRETPALEDGVSSLVVIWSDFAVVCVALQSLWRKLSARNAESATGGFVLYAH